MIGLIFFGAIALWMLLALNLGRKIPQWFKLKPEWSWLFVPLVFFMPVMDEVIALPQAYVLCKQAEDAFWYDPSVKGGVLKYYNENLSEEKIIGLNIKATIRHSSSIIKDTDRPAIKFMDVVSFSSGVLHMPAGSSTASMPLLLPDQGCPDSNWIFTNYQKALNLLNLTREPRPDLQ